MKAERFACVAWTVEDVQTLFNVSDEKAVEFLMDNAGHIQDRLVEVGWQVLETLGRADGLPGPVGFDE